MQGRRSRSKSGKAEKGGQGGAESIKVVIVCIIDVVMCRIISCVVCRLSVVLTAWLSHQTS
jgi:hypothetical protein